MSKQPKILFYDVETTPLKAYIWRCGKQHVNQSQLITGSNAYDIICIGYQWADNKKAEILDWGYEKQNSKQMIKSFTKMCDEADIIIGKNNKRFDDKHINTQRLIHGLDGRPDLLSKVDDLESQMRKHFYLPSNTLDYFSNMLNFGGKNPVQFQDWINIVEKKKIEGKKSYKKMLTYCKKDVEDTVNIWKYCEKHMSPKLNRAAYKENICCVTCGSVNIIRNGTRQAGLTTYQHYYCKSHGGYAGKTPLKSNKIRG